jgi:mannose-6-phosphate isomerase-like protein (cupin superfamily)
MRFLAILCLLLSAQMQIQAQVNSKALADVKPEKDYKNVASIPVYSDENASVFVIYVKNHVPKHYHKTHTETVIVLEGKGEMSLGGEIFDIKKGDQMVIPPGTHHSVVVKSKKPLKVVSIQAPKFENKDRFWVEE